MDITSIIRDFGFPVACCVALFIENRRNNKRNDELTDRILTTVENNTVALTEMKAVIKNE